MNTTTTTAAAEAAKNRVIYNKLADIAREVFNHMIAEPGKVYTPADIAAGITGGPVAGDLNRDNAVKIEPYALGAGLTWAEGYDPATVYEVAAGSFACKVNAWKVWAVLNNAARAWSIPTRDRVTFKKSDREAVPVVASFTLTATESRELLAATAADELRPVLCGVHLDTRRRVLVASDGHIMRVVNLGDRLTATADAAPSYNIHKSVIKAGRAVTIYADELAEAEGVAVKCYAGRFPNWAAVLTGYDYSEAGRVALTPAQFKDLKKAIAEVAKVHHADKWHPLRVTIAHTSGESVAHIWARDIDFATERESAVNIDPATPSFSIDTDARRLAKVTTAAALYVIDPAAALLMTDPAGLTVIMPLQPSEGDKYFAPFTVAPAGGRPDLLPGVDIAAAAAEITHAHRLASAAEILKNNADATADELAALVVSCSGHVLTDSEARDLLAEARELMTAAPAADGHQDTDTTTTTPAEVVSESESEPTAAAPAADHQDTPAEVISESESEPTTAAPADDDSQDTPAPVVAAADLLAAADVRDAAKAIAKAKTADDYDSQRAARDARRLLTAHGLTLTDYRIKTADGLTLCRFIYSYGKKSRRTLCAPLLKVAAEFAALSDLLAEFAELMTISESESQDTTTTTPAEVISEPTTPAPAADDSQGTPAEWCPLTGQYLTPADHLTPDEIRALVAAERERLADTDTTTTTPAEVISEPTAAAPAADGHQSDSEADALPVTFYDPAAGVIVWGLADDLPTADGLTAESVTAADLLTIESERESAAPADDHQDTTTTAHDSESRPRALLLTLTRAAVRLAVVVAALLLLTFANDRPTPATATTTAADLLAPADHQDTPAELMTISESESADTLTTPPAEVISEPTENEPTARPAADRPAVEKRHHARENKRESRAELMTAAAPAADLLTADSLTAAPVVDRDTLTAAEVISESQDTDTTRRPLLLTADELAELLALLTGTTTAESEPTAAPAADDSQDTPAEVISEPTESEPTAAPADGHQDTPATTGTTTTPAPAAGCPAAVATPCPPAAPVAPVAPIIF